MPKHRRIEITDDMVQRAIDRWLTFTTMEESPEIAMHEALEAALNGK